MLPSFFFRNLLLSLTEWSNLSALYLGPDILSAVWSTPLVRLSAEILFDLLNFPFPVLYQFYFYSVFLSFGWILFSYPNFTSMFHLAVCILLILEIICELIHILFESFECIYSILKNSLAFHLSQCHWRLLLLVANSKETYLGILCYLCWYSPSGDSFLVKSFCLACVEWVFASVFGISSVWWVLLQLSFTWNSSSGDTSIGSWMG